MQFRYEHLVIALAVVSLGATIGGDKILEVLEEPEHVDATFFYDLNSASIKAHMPFS